MTKPSKQRRKKRIEKRSDNKREKKKQEVGKCKTYRGKYQRDCWYLKTKYLTCHNIRHIVDEYSKKFSSASFSSSTKKKLCYI